MTESVNTPSAAWERQNKHWRLPEVLKGGTLLIREQAAEYLPQREAEVQKAWVRRVNASVLYGAYWDTVQKIAGRPFRKAITLKGTEKLHKQLQLIEADADFKGTTLTALAISMMEVAIHRGLTFLMVDYPTLNPPTGIEEGLGELPSAGQEQEHGLHPYFAHIDPVNVIGIKTVKVLGREIPTQVRIRQSATKQDPKNPYATLEVEQVKVWTMDHWELWEQSTVNNKTEWVKVTEAFHTYPGIPLAVFYINKTALYEGRPALEDLAWLNLRHFQSLSQQMTILDVVRSAILLRKGFSKSELTAGVVVGSASSPGSENENASIEWIEHSGKGTDAGFKDLETLEEKMETVGNQPFTRTSARATARGKAIDEDRTVSEVQSWLRDLEGCLTKAFSMSAIWVNTMLPKTFGVDVFQDFGINLNTIPSIEHLLKACLAGKLDDETYLREVKRRGELSSDTDILKVLQKAREDNLVQPDIFEDEEDEEVERKIAEEKEREEAEAK